VDPESIDLRDPINAAFWNDPALRSAIENTRKPAEIDAREYAAIFYAGGHGTMWDLPDDQPLAELASRLYQNGGIVSAVCHGPAGLLNVKLSDGSYLIAGKEVAAFTNEEEKAAGMESVIPFSLADRLAARGARHVSAPLWQSKVVVSGRLITGQNPASATGVGEAVATLLAQ
jgi:putative intracellular protease/amidase